MIIYADVLVVINIIVDYFLLSATGKLVRKKINAARLAAASFLCGLSALYIFVPHTTVIMEVLFRIVVCSVAVICCWSFGGVKEFVKAVLVLFLVTCGYGGTMTAVYNIFSPKGMAVKNSVVYFSISPVALIGFTILFYISFCILSSIFKRSAPLAERCSLKVWCDGIDISLNAICDSGNSLTDVFGKSEIIIANKEKVEELFGGLDFKKNRELSTRYRLVPCNTVSGEDVLEGFRCDRAEVTSNNKNITLASPIIAVSKVKLNGDYNAIINPEIIK